MMMKLKWTTEFPTKEGYYWFYGYRFGRESCGQKCKPEWMIVKAIQCANAITYSADGHFMCKSEVEDAHFAPLELPEFPKINP